jgi:hypothetical protein
MRQVWPGALGKKIAGPSWADLMAYALSEQREQQQQSSFFFGSFFFL